MTFTIFQNEKTPFQTIKTRTSNSPKIDIFSKGLTHGFSLKWPFLLLFFQPIQARKTSFTILQIEKTPFQTIKTTTSKSRKIDIFSKGLTHSFDPKMAIFPIFLLGNIGQENVFCDILEQKNAFLGYKKQKFKTLKNARFFKGVNPWFRSKNGHFSNFFFQAIQPRKMSFAIFYNEKVPLQAIKKRSSKL